MQELDPGRPATGRRVTRALGTLTLALAALSLGLPNIAPSVDFLAAPGSPVRMFFGVSEEMGLWAFLSVGIFLGGAAAHALAAVLARAHDRRLSLAFAATSVVLLLFGFDDFAALHERLAGLGEQLESGLAIQLGYTWVLPGVVLAAFCCWCFWNLMTRLTGPPRTDLLLGLALFFGGALGMESLNGVLDAPGTNGWPLQLGTHLEEILENFGAILLLRAAVRALVVTGPTPLVVRFATETLRSGRREGRPAEHEGERPETSRREVLRDEAARQEAARQEARREEILRQDASQREN
ncbi:hypothetical protein [Modestobacter marinus]|uniref:hypothetical protein n=1 Tax=Modestobacter marinus TaxID=477641 RepID=UPI001C986638|nr:hypothetical protein [Modestobacter marinus]